MSDRQQAAPVTMSANPIQVHSWKVHPVTDRHQKPCSPETGLQPGLYMELEGPDHTPLSACVAGVSVKKRNTEVQSVQDGSAAAWAVCSVRAASARQQF